MVYEQSIVLMWMLSFGILIIGVLSHQLIGNEYYDEVSVVRFIGIVIGLIGFIGFPVSLALNPYVADVTYLEAGIAISVTTIFGFVIGHYGWKWLGPSSDTS